MRYLMIVVFFILPLSAFGAETWGPYKARVLEVIDGDTVRVEVSVWPGSFRVVDLRIAGIDTPEKNGKACERVAAKRATGFTLEFLKGAKSVTVRDVRLGKYAGRVLGRLLRGRKDLGKALIKAGLARPYNGGARKPWC